MSRGTRMLSILAAALAIFVLADKALAGGGDDDGLRTEIIEMYVDPCSIGIVHKNPETRSIPDHHITLVIRTFTRHGLEEMLDLWIPKVRKMTETERYSFYAEKLEWCITTDIGARERERIRDAAVAIE